MGKRKTNKPKDYSKTVVEYDSNNSGGSWWLEDDDWRNLEKAGWEVEWYKDSKYHKNDVDKNGRWLGALASGAKRVGLSLDAAIAEWETITGECASDAGCSCCGQPHSFSAENEDGSCESGPDVEYDRDDDYYDD